MFSVSSFKERWDKGMRGSFDMSFLFTSEHGCDIYIKIFGQIKD